MLALLLTLSAGAGFAKETDLPGSNPTPRMSDTSGAAYVAEAISVPPKFREQFIECLRAGARPHWATLRDEGLLADLSVFETTKVRLTRTGDAEWNFLILSHLRSGVAPTDFFAKVEGGQHSSVGGPCIAQRGVEVRRIEVLRPTPKSSYPRTAEADDSEAQSEKVNFIIEYIAVDETPAALKQYRESMGQNMGPAMSLMIPEKTFFQLIALETEEVRYSQRGTPPWNQIHIRGYYPEKGANPKETPVALERVNPSAGRNFFANLDKIRTKPREDEARQIYDLSIRRRT